MLLGRPTYYSMYVDDYFERFYAMYSTLDWDPYDEWLSGPEGCSHKFVGSCLSKLLLHPFEPSPFFVGK